MGVDILVDQLDVRDFQPLQAERVLEPTDRLGAGEIDLYRFPVGQTEAPPLEVADGLDPGFGASEDQLGLVCPRQADHAGVTAPGSGADRRDIAAMANRVPHGVAEVGFTRGEVVRFQDRAELCPLLTKYILQPAMLDRDAKAGGDGAAGVPQGVERFRHRYKPLYSGIEFGDSGGEAVRIGGARQVQVLAQGRALIFGAEQPAALQFGDYQIDELVERTRQK